MCIAHYNTKVVVEKDEERKKTWNQHTALVKYKHTHNESTVEQTLSAMHVMVRWAL